jgi:lipopolysaccharide transport system permease protein
MQIFLATPGEIVASSWRNRNLIKELVKRDVIGRYRGASLGLVWSFLNPLFLLAIYTFVFSFVFKARWSQGNESKTEFALVLFAGLIVFGLFSECVSRSPSIILANANYVKKVVFPLEILPLVALGSAIFHALISIVVWLSAYLLFFGWPHLTVLWLPVVLFPLALYTLGFSWFLASLGVYLRDVSQLIGTLMTALMFISPIFYPASALPEPYRAAMYVNPLTSAIEQVRNVMYWGRSPSAWEFGLNLFVGAVIASLGFAWFQKTRKGFADVI